ncbi:MAG TPA: hypothetical protein VFI26_00660 [Lysobacter sp.]|nr:hypothetical protein [Lysobacter sp.]
MRKRGHLHSAVHQHIDEHRQAEHTGQQPRITVARLTATDMMPAFAIGTSRGFDKRWRWGAELLYVPPQVRREADGPSENDPPASMRLYLRHGME